MKKWIKVLLGLAVFGIIAAFLVFKFYINKPHADISKAKAAFEFSAKDLWEKYNTDTKLSDSLYTGKVIQLDGTVSRVEKGDSTTYVVFVMEADSMFGDKSIRCELDPEQTKENTAIAKDAAIKLKGLCSGYDQTDVKFTNTFIIK
jgi:hypothetical protein